MGVFDPVADPHHAQAVSKGNGVAHKWRTSGNRTGNGRVSYGYQHPAYKHAMTHLSSGGPSITALAASRLV